MATANFNEPTSAANGNIPYIGAEPGDNNDGTTLRESFKRVNARLKEIFGAQDGSNVVQTPFVDNDNIKDNAVDHDELAARYTAKQDISTTTGTINLDASLYAIFELTGNLGTVTLNIQNLKKGQVIDILLTGTLTSAVITLSDDFTTSQINKVGSTSLDTSKKNILQVLCADDNDADAILNYAIATYEADTNPD